MDTYINNGILMRNEVVSFQPIGFGESAIYIDEISHVYGPSRPAVLDKSNSKYKEYLKKQPISAAQFPKITQLAATLSTIAQQQVLCLPKEHHFNRIGIISYVGDRPRSHGECDMGYSHYLRAVLCLRDSGILNVCPVWDTRGRHPVRVPTNVGACIFFHGVGLWHQQALPTYFITQTKTEGLWLDFRYQP